MKTILITILLISANTFSQVTLDSAEVSRLIDKLHRLEYLEKNDSLNNELLNVKDTIIINLETEVSNYSRMNFNLEETNFYLKKQLAEVSEGGLKWYHYAGGSTLILIIGILTGLLIK